MYWRTKEYPSDNAKKTPNAAESCTHMEGPTCFGFWPPSRGLRGICLRGLAMDVHYTQRSNFGWFFVLIDVPSHGAKTNDGDVHVTKTRLRRKPKLPARAGTNSFQLPASSFELLENTAIVSAWQQLR